MARFLSLLLIVLLTSACTLTVQPEGSSVVPTETNDLAGIYKAFSPAASSPGIEMTLTLSADGSVSWKWDYLEPDGVRTELGSWTADGADTIQLSFSEQQIGDEVQVYETPTEVTLTQQDDGTLQQVPATDEAIGLTFYPFAALATGALLPAYDSAAVSAEFEAGNWAGLYKAFLPAASSPGIDSSLLLAFDQSVSWTQDYLDGESPIVEVGTWEANEDGTITVTLTERAGEALATPQILVLAPEENLLTATDAEEATYGAGLRFYSFYGLAVATMPQ